MSASPVLLGIDPGTRRMGYCVGTGEGLPLASAWRFDQCGDNLGAMGSLILGELREIMDRERPAVVAYEQPIKTRFDTTPALRKTFSLGTLIEVACYERQIACYEVNLHDVKRELTGLPGAQKHEMVRAAEKLGVSLPVTGADGREDAADALGIWLLLLRSRSPKLSYEFDRRLWGARGGLPF